MCRLMPAALLKGFEAPVCNGLPAHTTHIVHAARASCNPQGLYSQDLLLNAAIDLLTMKATTNLVDLGSARMIRRRSAGRLGITTLCRPMDVALGRPLALNSLLAELPDCPLLAGLSANLRTAMPAFCYRLD